MAAPPLDLRTYLLLERSFQRRLQRSWQQLSAPVYAAIAEDCRNKAWDKARQRVPELDMAEVGTQNREWITYMLRSFAVFGAGTVSRKKPSFVGTGNFDTFLKQTTANFLQSLEFSATAQVQAEALQSIAEDEAKSKAVKFDPRQLRDAQGRWTSGGLTTDQGNVYQHGTAQAFLDDIIKNGLSGEHTGRIHTYDVDRPRLAGKPVGDPGHVYMTTDEAEARRYAESAATTLAYGSGKDRIPPTLQDIVYSEEVPEAERTALAWESGTEVGGGMPAVVTVTLPPEIVLQLRKDKKSDLLSRDRRKPSKAARSYKGTIKPEWITSISYMTRDIATGTETWHTITPSEWKAPPPTRLPHAPKELKAAAEGQTFYVPLVIPLEKPEGLGGITRKFDAALHPRGDDGRFIEATNPRIFNRMEDVGQYDSWGEKKWAWRTTEEEAKRYGGKAGEPGGKLLTGEPIPRDQLPPTLYHVTTNAPAVEESGVLLGLLESGGLGGGQAQGVSFTTSKEDATVIQRELKRAVQIARGDVGIEDLEKWARADEKEAGLPEGALNKAIAYAMEQWEGNKFIIANDYAEGKGWTVPRTPEEAERIRRSVLKDVFNAYLGSREEQAARSLGQKEWPYNVPLMKNPILFGQQEHLAKIRPEDVGTVEVPSANIPEGALVTTGSDKFLHEVRSYSDVPVANAFWHRRKKFEEANVVRSKEKGHEGEFATKTGVSSTPELATQAKAGIAAVEALLPEAVAKANYSGVSGGWELLNEQARELVRQNYETNTFKLTREMFDTTELDNEVIRDVEAKHQEAIQKTAVERLQSMYAESINPATIIPDPSNKDWLGELELKWDEVRHHDGTPLTTKERDALRLDWHAKYGYAWAEKVDEYKKTEEYEKRKDAAARLHIAQSWKSLDPQRKMELAVEMRLRGELSGDVVKLEGEPKKWVTGVETGAHGEDNYTRTHAIAIKLTEMRFDQLRKERGLLEPQKFSGEDWREHFEVTGDEAQGKWLVMHKYGSIAHHPDDEPGELPFKGTKAEAEAHAQVLRQRMLSDTYTPPDSADVIQKVWAEWKRKSSRGLGLSLQLAAARELGGHHRMTPEEVKIAEDTAADPSVGGMKTLQAYVRAQWEVTQTIMAKAGQDKVSVYRGLQLPGAQVEATSRRRVDAEGNPLPATEELVKTATNRVYGQNPQNGKYFVAFDYGGDHFVAEKKNVNEPNEEAMARRLDKHLRDKAKDYGPHSEGFVQLPDIDLKRAGAQSTTGTRDVANNWDGVGDLPENAERVVLRIEAPATSVLSIPVYGKNVQGEHESVLLGTPDHWLWDAWRGKAPSFQSHAVRKAETKPLIIDLQAEDRDKPHWMSSVDWANVVKWEEAQHPRDAKGQFTEGVGDGTKAPEPDRGTGGSGGSAVPQTAAQAKASSKSGRPEAVPEVQAVADAYNERHGLPPVKHDYVKLDEARAGTIADAYDALPLDDSQNPEVREAYKALAKEIRQQYDHIVSSGMTFIPWTKEGQPYQNSTEMVNDIRDNQRMYFYTGGEPNEFMSARDPDTGLTVNDMFRAVHDYFGHAAGGFGFGPRGEENAWMSHSQMLTPEARRALTTETRGQNSWVNFGRHNYDAEGNHLNIPPQDRPFATQKTALLPEHYALLPGERSLKWDESRHPRNEEGEFTRVAMTSQRAPGDPGHMPNKQVFEHMREFHESLAKLPGVSRVSVKPGVGGWEGGSESMWQIYYRGNGEARKLVAQTAKKFNQDAVLILNGCTQGQDCQPSTELSFKRGLNAKAREAIHKILVSHGIGGWTWMKRDGKTVLRMVCVPQWGAEAKTHQGATAAVSDLLRKRGLSNNRRVHKVAVSVMEREGENSYDRAIG